MNIKSAMFRMVVLAACGLCIGCVSEEEFFWLPDSSGFLYFESESSCVVLFDVGKRAQRRVVKLDLPNGQSRPGKLAIKPDGKQFAIAIGDISVKSDSFSEAIRFEIYNMDGTRVYESSVFRRSRKRKSTADITLHEVNNYAAWSPDGNRIVFFAQVSGCTGDSGADPLPSIGGYYDLQDEEFHLLPEDLSPCLSGPYFFGACCFVPDNKGLLCSGGASGEGFPRFRVIDWNGWEQDLKVDSNIMEMIEAEQKDTGGVSGLAPVWEDNTLAIPFADGKILFDLGKRVARFDSDAAQRELRQYARSQRCQVLAQLDGGFVLQLRPVGKGTEDEDRRLEIAVPSEGKSKTLVPDSTGNGLVAVSPDKRFAVLNYVEPGGDHMLVIDSKGQVVVDQDR